MRLLQGEGIGSKKLHSVLTAIWVLQRSMPASLIPATTEAAARRPPWDLSVSVLQAGPVPHAPQVSPGCGPSPF